ncbi:hypothetical protein EMCRGX_G023524 [Ephydatia muelleri]|eukprot:Em0017g194a
MQTCSCQCSNVTQCPTNYQWDSNTCTCKCGLTCQYSGQLDARSCKCACNETCDDGYKLDANCECVPLTCSTAETIEECGAAHCDSDPTRLCSYISKVGKCTCPCCVAKDNPGYTNYCNSWSNSILVNLCNIGTNEKLCKKVC